MKIMTASFKRSHAHTATFSDPSPVAGHCQWIPLPETCQHSWAGLGHFLVGSLLLSPGSWCTQGSVCTLQESVSPVQCKFRWLYGGVNGDLLQEGLCHSQVCCTQIPCPCGRPLLTSTSQETLKYGAGVAGSWCWSNFEEISHIQGQRRSPSKMVGGAKSCL